MSEFRSGRTIRGTERMHRDVAVVGSGAGGAAAAYELARAGLSVVVLEAGPRTGPEDFTQRELDTLQRFYVDQGQQGPADGSLSILQGRMLGGSTVINAEVCFRIPDDVLEEWARDHGVRGLSPADMRDAFETVERMIHATRNEGPHLTSGARFSDGLTKLGLEAKPLVRSVKDCVGCCYCLFGCAYGCKQSTDRSYLPAAMAAGATVISDARVERLVVEGKRAAGVVARTEEGEIQVETKTVILACGAIETPLFLLDHKLGGRHVGRHLAVHPVAGVLAWYDDERTEYRSAMLASYSDAYAKDGFMLEFAAASPPFTAPFAPGFGRKHKEMARELRKASLVAVIVRDARSTGRVRRGRRGEKIIEHAVDARTRQRMRRGLRAAGEIAFASGARRVTVSLTAPFEASSPAELRALDSVALGPADASFISYHPQGTARLGVVTDHDGAVQGVRGLYVMDASLFPSPVGVNTQVPVMAVATVLARRLAARLVS